MEIGQKWSQSSYWKHKLWDSISGSFKEILKPIFRHLRQWKEENKLPEAYVFDTGSKIGKPMMFGLKKMQRN
jgi:hypothetical protein